MFSIRRLTLEQPCNSRMGPAPYDMPTVIISAALTLSLDKNYTKTPVTPAQISQRLGVGAISRLYPDYQEAVTGDNPLANRHGTPHISAWTYPLIKEIAMNITSLFKALVVSLPLVVGAQATSAAGMADDLMKALKSCGADAKTMKAAESLIKKSKGMPSDDDIDDFIDSIDSDKLADCVDDAL